MPGHHRIDLGLVIHQRIHAGRSNCWWVILVTSARAVPPSRASAVRRELGVRVAQAVEHHHPDQRLDVRWCGACGGTPAATTETELLPQLGECPTSPSARADSNVTDGAAGRAPSASRPATFNKPLITESEFAAELIESPQSRNGALLHPPGIVPIGLDGVGRSDGSRRS